MTTLIGTPDPDEPVPSITVGPVVTRLTNTTWLGWAWNGVWHPFEENRGSQEG